MDNRILGKAPWFIRFLLCLMLSFSLCIASMALSPKESFRGKGRAAKLIFEKPDFNRPLPADPEEEPQANPGYRIEHTRRGLVRFRTEFAGSPSFGTPIPEILPYSAAF